MENKLTEVVFSESLELLLFHLLGGGKLKAFGFLLFGVYFKLSFAFLKINIYLKINI